MSKCRPNIPENMRKLTTNQMENLIEDSNLGIEDTKIAKMYLIDKIPQVEIAEEIGVTQRTICSRCKMAINKMSSTMKEDWYSDTNDTYGKRRKSKVIYLKDLKAV